MVAWTAVRKSSHSAGKDNCVGVAWSRDGSAVLIVDTKSPEAGGLIVSADEARQLFAAIGRQSPA